MSDGALISLECLEDFHYLSFMDLTSTFTAHETYQKLLDCYRDIALLKSLYWRMVPTFRFLVAQSEKMKSAREQQSYSPIYSMFLGLARSESDQEFVQCL